MENSKLFDFDYFLLRDNGVLLQPLFHSIKPFAPILFHLLSSKYKTASSGNDSVAPLIFDGIMLFIYKQASILVQVVFREKIPSIKTVSFIYNYYLLHNLDSYTLLLIRETVASIHISFIFHLIQSWIHYYL